MEYRRGKTPMQRGENFGGSKRQGLRYRAEKEKRAEKRSKESKKKPGAGKLNGGKIIMRGWESLITRRLPSGGGLAKGLGGKTAGVTRA